jgi:dihydrofolate reductase
MLVNLIVALDKNNGIGINNKMPWHFTQDMIYFKNHTKGAGNNAIIMGKNTYLSIGKRLPYRDNIVLSTTLDKKNIDTKFFLCRDMEELETLLDKNNYDAVWVIGGSNIYNCFLENPHKINKIFITEIDEEYNCDKFFPTLISTDFILTTSYTSYENNTLLKFNIFENKLYMN